MVDDQAFICHTVTSKHVHPRAIRLHCGSGMGGVRAQEHQATNALAPAANFQHLQQGTMTSGT